MSLVVETPATDEPEDVADVMLHCRVAPGLNDSRFANMHVAAREQIELETGRQFMKATWTLKLPRWWSGVLDLPKPPFQSVSEIRYQDSDDAQQTLSSSVYGTTTRALDSPFGGIYLADDQEWPTLYGAANALEVEIDFVCGYSDSADVDSQRAAIPSRVNLAIRELTSHFYWNGVGEIPAGLNHIFWGLKVPILEYEEAA